jgi:hypothetical protein
VSLSVPYETVEEAEMRLSGTVVLYDGEPVYVTKVAHAKAGDPNGDIFRVYARPLPYKPNLEDKINADGQDVFRKFISSRKFDMATIKMGFLNTGKGLLYCSRKPSRQFKQGLSNNTLVATPVTANVRAANMAGLLPLKEFAAMLKREYPSYAATLLKMQKDETVIGMAFHPHFAVVRDAHIPELLYLYHKQDKVGLIQDKKVVLTKGMRCLKESIQELGINVEA